MLAYRDGRLVEPSLRDISEAVYSVIQLIPPGMVTTYGSIARLLGISPRLVGKLLAANDKPIIIPCHRVVKSDGSLGGYSAKGGPKFKKMLLELEGVKFTEKGRVAHSHMVDLEVLLGLKHPAFHSEKHVEVGGARLRN